jgi:hypothetical protein
MKTSSSSFLLSFLQKLIKHRFLLLMTLLVWNLIGLGFVVSAYIDAYRFNPNFRFSWAFIALVMMVYNGWGVLSVVLYQRLKSPIQQQQWIKCALIFILGLLLWQPLISSFDVLLSRALLGIKVDSFWQELLQFRLLDLYQQSMLYVFGFSACALVIYWQLQQHYAHSQRELADMKMQVLQSQLSPHFLFNCLNSISAMARQGEREIIVEATAQLADLLRFSLNASGHHTISIQEELEFTQAYIQLQNLRFGERYICVIHNELKEEQYQRCTCPPFVLQTLIENAFMHNLGTVADPVTVHASLSHNESSLLIEVCNDVKVHHNNSTMPQGLSLALDNLKHRLGLIYHNNANLVYGLNDAEFCVRLRLPNLKSTGHLS